MQHSVSTRISRGNENKRSAGKISQIPLSCRYHLLPKRGCGEPPNAMSCQRLKMGDDPLILSLSIKLSCPSYKTSAVAIASALGVVAACISTV